MEFWVYILRCSDGSYYAGHTDNLEVRLAQHQSGELESYTRNRRPVELAWKDAFPDCDSAFAAEMQIKGWSRSKKEALMKGDWKLVSILARCRSRNP